MNPWRLFGVLAGLLFFAAIAAAFYQTGSANDAKARAESLSALRMEAAEMAHARSVEARDARELAAAVIAEATRRREDADREIRRLTAQNEAVTHEAVQTGDGVLQAVRALDGASVAGSSADLEALVLAHLEDDREVARVHEEERAEWLNALAAEEARSGAFEMRAIAAEVALDASELACHACELEAEAWREAASPGWFARLRRGVPSMILAAGVTALALIL